MTVRIYKLPKRLTRRTALRLVRQLDRKRDFRAFTYNQRTGYATLL